MSMELRVRVEVADSSDADDVLIRYEHTETVMPETVEDTANDHAAIVVAVFDRVIEEAKRTLTEQINQVASILGALNE